MNRGIILKEIFTILQKGDKYCKIGLKDENHPIFKAHFPNNPILPGFVLLQIASSIFGKVDLGIKRAKFLHQILPQSILELTLEDGSKSSKVIVLQKEIKMAEIIYAKE